MGLFSSGKDTRRMEVSRLANGNLQRISFSYFTLGIPYGMSTIHKDSNSAVFAFPTQTGTFNPLEKETFGIQRIRKEDLAFRPPYTLSPTLEQHFMGLQSDFASQMPIESKSGVAHLNINGFPALRTTINTMVNISITIVAFDFMDGYFYSIQTMYETFKKEEYNHLIDRIILSIE